jgi:hypothetical protein
MAETQRSHQQTHNRLHDVLEINMFFLITDEGGRIPAQENDNTFISTQDR